jgi:hypothetical protein
MGKTWANSRGRSPAEAGNDFALIPVTTGINIAAPLGRLSAMHKATTGMQDLASGIGARTLIEISEAMPAHCSAWPAASWA